MRTPYSAGIAMPLVMVLMLVLLISIASITSLVRQESKETVKGRRSTAAFHLAEAGIDQGIWKLQESMTIWTQAKAGTAVTDYNGATAFSMTLANGQGGQYNVTFSSGPSTGQVTILAKGRDVSTQEIRAIRAVVAEAGMGTTAIQAQDQASFGAATTVEWGSIIGRTSIDSGGKNHPRFYSAGDITGKDANGSTLPNTDGIQWWSYKTDLPAVPQIDLPSYKALAVAAGNSADAQCGSYYKNNPGVTFQFKGCTDAGSKNFYIEGHCEFASGAGGNYVLGNVLCMGDLSVQGNGGGYQSVAASVPSEAWKEYGNDWAFYKATYNPTCPHATYAAAVAAAYSPTGLTYTIEPIVHGFLYTGGSQGLTGGGNGEALGVLYSTNDSVLATSNFTFYYSPTVAAAVLVTNVIISRSSWKEVTGQTWP